MIIIRYGNAHADRQEEIREIHPGEVLAGDFLKPLNMTPYRLGPSIGLMSAGVGEITRGERNITAGIARHPAKFWGASPEFWRNLQRRYDLMEARRKIAVRIDSLEPYSRELIESTK